MRARGFQAGQSREHSGAAREWLRSIVGQCGTSIPNDARSGSWAYLPSESGLVLLNAVVTTTRLASVGKPLATKEDLFSRSPFRASFRIDDPESNRAHTCTSTCLADCQ